MDRLSLLNDVASPGVVLPIVILSALLLVCVLRPRLFDRLRFFGLSNRATLLCSLGGALLVTSTFSALDPKVIPWGGVDDYYARAMNIVTYGVYGRGTGPSAMFPPGYSFILFPFVLLLGTSPWAFCIANVAFLLAGALAVRQLLLGLGADARQANVAAALLFLTPNRLFSTLLPLSDVPFSLLWTASLGLLLLSNRYPERRILPIASGCLAGCAAIVRSPGLLYLVPLLAGIMASRSEAWPSRRIRALLMVAGAVLVLAPWTVRNYLQWGKVIPVSNNGGYNLLIGNNPLEPITWNPYVDTSAVIARSIERAGGAGWSEAQKDSFFARQAIAYVRQTPVATLERGVAKIARTFNADSYSFGYLETYTNARRIFFPLRSAPPRNRDAAKLGQAIYAFYYHAVYILNGIVYYLLLGLTFRFLIADRFMRTPASAVIAIMAICVAVVVFLFFGMSRYKEPLGAAMVLYVAVKLFVEGRGVRSDGSPQRESSVTFFNSRTIS